MPRVHRYECLNPNCPEPEYKLAIPRLFRAFNNSPKCIFCESYKVNDFGEEPNASPGPVLEAPYASNGSAKYIDSALRSEADRLGVTNMSNKDGKAVKSDQQGTYGTKRFYGTDVPLTGMGEKIHTVRTPMGGMIKAPQGARLQSGVSLPTQVVAK